MNSGVSSNHSLKGEKEGRKDGKGKEKEKEKGGGGHRRYLSLGDEGEEEEGRGGGKEFEEMGEGKGIGIGKGEAMRGRGQGDDGGGEEGNAMEGLIKGKGKAVVQGPRELGSRTPTGMRSPKRGSLMAKGVGIGTPGSLYDGAGFLRERESGNGRDIEV